MITTRNAALPLLALGASAPGLLSLLAPASPLLPWTLAPLHGRCVGVMQLAPLLALWPAWRRADPALARGPLRALVASCAGAIAGLLAAAAAQRALASSALAWLLLFALLGGGAEWLTRSAHEVQAPAERPDLAWLAIGAAAAALALALLVAPAAVAARWPWRMAPALAAAYVGPFGALAALAISCARERRGYVRRLLLLPLFVLPLALLGVSAWHRGAFTGAAGVLWFAAFAALAALAALRLLALRGRIA